MSEHPSHPENAEFPGTLKHDMREFELAVRDLGRALAKEPPFCYARGVYEWLAALLVRWERRREGKG